MGTFVYLGQPSVNNYDEDIDTARAPSSINDMELCQTEDDNNNIMHVELSGHQESSVDRINFNV